MSHIDSGTLHEYLDRQLSESRRAAVEDHLADCEACQARLDEARGVARASSDLLAELEPGPTPAPAWDDLRQRAESRSSHGSKGGNWLKPGLAWAASIALAFVMGWSASNYLQITAGLSPTTADRSATPSPALVADSEGEADAASPSDDLDAGEPAESRLADPARPTVSEEAAEAGAQAGDAASRPMRQAADEFSGRRRPAREPGAVTDAAAGAAVSEPKARDRAVTETARPAELPSVTVMTPSRREDAGAIRAETIPPSQSLSDDAENERIWVDALGSAALGEEQKAAVLNAIREDVRQRSGFRAAAATLFHTVRLEEARRLLGGPLRTLPGLQRRDVEIGPGAAVPGALLDVPVVRSVYTDAAGNEITLVQQRPGQGTMVGGEDDPLPTLTVSPSGLTAYRWRGSEGYRLVLIGELPGDSLRALADRVR